MIKIIVCMKQVIDPEAPVSAFKVDVEAKKVIPPRGTPPVLSPFDENALEAALEIKDTQDAQVTVLSMGPNFARAVVKKPLGAGADDLILLQDEAFEDLDSYSTAYALASAINKVAEYDLVLCGLQASDTDAGQVAAGIAETLGIPIVTMARKVEVSDGTIRVERVTADGYEVVETTAPAVVTGRSEIGELRSATVEKLMAARKKEAVVWNAQELGIDPAQLSRASLLKLYQPVHEGTCEIIQGETPEDAAVNLAQKLKDGEII